MVREASEADLDRVLPLVRAYHEFEGIDLTDEQRETALRVLLGNRRLGGIWLVEQDGAPVGYIALCFGYSIEFGGLEAVVDEFFVKPEFRGRGLGARTLALVKDEARERGVGALHLEVARTNTKAQRFYSRAGFVARDKYLQMTVAL